MLPLQKSKPFASLSLNSHVCFIRLIKVLALDRSQNVQSMRGLFAVVSPQIVAVLEQFILSFGHRVLLPRLCVADIPELLQSEIVKRSVYSGLTNEKS